MDERKLLEHYSSDFHSFLKKKVGKRFVLKEIPTDDVLSKEAIYFINAIQSAHLDNYLHLMEAIREQEKLIRARFPVYIDGSFLIACADVMGKFPLSHEHDLISFEQSKENLSLKEDFVEVAKILMDEAEKETPESFGEPFEQFQVLLKMLDQHAFIHVIGPDNDSVKDQYVTATTEYGEHNFAYYSVKDLPNESAFFTFTKDIISKKDPTRLNIVFIIPLEHHMAPFHLQKSFLFLDHHDFAVVFQNINTLRSVEEKVVKDGKIINAQKTIPVKDDKEKAKASSPQNTTKADAMAAKASDVIKNNCADAKGVQNQVDHPVQHPQNEGLDGEQKQKLVDQARSMRKSVSEEERAKRKVNTWVSAMASAQAGDAIPAPTPPSGQSSTQQQAVLPKKGPVVMLPSVGQGGQPQATSTNPSAQTSLSQTQGQLVQAQKLPVQGAQKTQTVPSSPEVSAPTAPGQTQVKKALQASSSAQQKNVLAPQMAPAQVFQPQPSVGDKLGQGQSNPAQEAQGSQGQAQGGPSQNAKMQITVQSHPMVPTQSQTNAQKKDNPPSSPPSSGGGVVPSSSATQAPAADPSQTVERGQQNKPYMPKWPPHAEEPEGQANQGQKQKAVGETNGKGASSSPTAKGIEGKTASFEQEPQFSPWSDTAPEEMPTDSSKRIVTPA